MIELASFLNDKILSIAFVGDGVAVQDHFRHNGKRVVFENGERRQVYRCIQIAVCGYDHIHAIGWNGSTCPIVLIWPVAASVEKASALIVGKIENTPLADIILNETIRNINWDGFRNTNKTAVLGAFFDNRTGAKVNSTELRAVIKSFIANFRNFTRND